MSFVILNENRELDISLQTALDAFHERCEIFRDEREFLERMKSGNIRAIFVVIYTESLDGLLVMEKIRRMQNVNTIPLIAVSALKHPLPFIDAYEHEVAEYFTFPLNVQEFIQKMRKILNI